MALTLLCSCTKKSEYIDDLPCDELARSLSKVASVADGYLEHGEEQIKFFFNDTKLQDDFSILYSAKVKDINEIGAFHCPDKESAEKLLEIVEEYLDEMEETQESFIMGYAPMEIAKLDEAEARRYGNYVIYAILDTKQQKELWSMAEDILSPK